MDPQNNRLWFALLKAFRARGWLALALILLAGWSMYYSWRHPHIKVVSQPYYVPMPSKPGPERIVYVDRVVVVEKPAALPESVAKDTQQLVTATGTVAPYEGNTSVAAIIKFPEGRTTLFMKREPLPFFEFRNKGYLDVGWGFRNFSEQGSGKVTWEYARIGRAVLWNSLEQNSRPETIIMTGARIELW